MIEPTLPALLALVLAAIALLVAVAMAWRSRRSAKPKALPSEWALAPRPVFNTEERRLYRQLREALPHHVLLAKLPLVRLCQPADPQEVRYWYDLLGSTHVTFAICSPNGRVLAAIDFDRDRDGTRRTLQIKQAVLGACRIRYLRCPADHLPSIHELQLLVPQAGAGVRSPQASVAAAAVYAPPPVPLQAEREPAVATPRRRKRPTLWQDSGFFHDSFFGVENRMEVSYPSEFSPFSQPTPAPARAPRRDDRGHDALYEPTPPYDPTESAPWPERGFDDEDDDGYRREPRRYGASGNR